jgi:ammonium transporter, Amt family
MFPEQVSTDVWLGSVLYLIGTVGCVLAFVAVSVIDFGAVRARSSLDTVLQKVVAAFIAIGGFMLIGYAIWNWQYNTAFEIPNPLWQSIKDWWAGGVFQTNPAANIDAKLEPNLDQLQVFVPFIAAYAGIVVALIHSSVLEKVKAGAMYIIAFVVGAFLVPVVLYLTWGSVSPLTNSGVHDFVGLFGGYLTAGTFALVLQLRLRRDRPAAEAPAEAAEPQSLGLLAIGVGLLLVAVVMIVPGCGFLIPEFGYIGISGTTSGLGLVVINLFAAITGGTLSGAVIAYRTRIATWVVLGPVAGYIAGTALFDIATPLAAAGVGFGATFVALGVDKLLTRARINEHKIIPLGLGAGIWGAIMAGVVGWGDKTGGYPELTGTYEFQNATINPLWQLIGVAATLAIVGAVAFVTIWICERTVGLRVSPEDEEMGLDAAYWDVPETGAELGAPADSSASTVPAA